MVVIKSIHGKYTIRLFIKVYFTRVQYAAFGSLVKQTESHVIVRFFLRLFLLLLLCRGRTTASGSYGTTGWDRGELLASGSDNLLDVLSVELRHELSKLVTVGLSTNRS